MFCMVLALIILEKKSKHLTKPTNEKISKLLGGYYDL